LISTFLIIYHDVFIFGNYDFLSCNFSQN